MTQYAKKEKYEGPWIETGTNVSFSRQWGGVRFTDEQCQALLNGEEIRFTAVNRNGDEYEAYGKLEAQSFETTDQNGEPRTINFIGFRNRSFDPDYDANGNELPPKVFAKYEFTEEERAKLAAGERIFVDSFVSRNDKPFAATVSFDHVPGRDQKKIELHFSN